MGPRSALERAALLLMALGVSACAAQPSNGGGPGDASPAPAPQASAPRACEPGAARCLGPDQLERCEPGGARLVTEACGPARTCLGDRCVSTTVAPTALVSDRPFDPATLSSLSAEGFVNAWAARSPVDSLRLAGLGAAAERGELPADLELTALPLALCAPSGYVVPARVGRTPGLGGALLAGVLVVGHAGPLEIWLGAAGKLTLYLDGKKLLQATGETEPAPRPDELVARAEVSEGAHPLVVLLEHPKVAPGLWLRVRGPGHTRRDDLLFAPAPTRDPACTPADLATLRLEASPVEQGFDLTLSAAFHGLVPRAAAPLPFLAELVEGKKIREIARGSLDVHAAAEGLAQAPLAVRGPTGTSRLRVSLIGAPEASRRELLLAYRGELHARILALRARLADLPFGDAPEGDRDSLRGEVEMLVAALAAQDADLPYLQQRTQEAEDLAAAFASGKNPYDEKKGVVYRAYRSRLDGQLQPYLALVPRAFEKSKRFPLILGMHGLNGQPGQALRTVLGEAPDRGDMNVLGAARHLPALPDYGAFVVAPTAYGNAGQRLPGEDDVLRVIEEMKQSYPIDADRVSITGYSLGGTVSFVVPLHYPDVFSAAAPLCGYPNFAQWTEVREPPHTPWEDILIQKRSIVHYCENGLHLPLHIIHGGQDGPDRSAIIADRYAALGYPRVFDVQDDLDHDVWEYGYEKGKLAGWLRARKRPKAPRHVRLSSGEARYDRAFWVTLLEAKSPESFARIDAEAGSEVKVSTENVEALALDLSAFDAKSLIVDGTKLPACGGRGTSYVTFEDGVARCSTTAPSLAGKKHAGVAGPLDDIQRHAALVVYGTGDPGNAEVNKLVAEQLRNPERSSLSYPIKADVDVRDEELGRSSLILVGGPASNKITRALLDALPVRFDDKGLTLRGKRHEGDSVGVSLIVPNPRNAEEYLVLHAGVGARGTLLARQLPSLVPDYLVYDERLASPRGGLLLGARAVLDGGFFDKQWR